MSGNSKEAVDLFLKGYNCAQAVLYACRKETGLSEDLSLKISSGLGAGLARKGHICGAVSGGILVLGMRHGRGREDDRTAMDLTYAKTRELMDRFAEKHGSCICRDLLKGCDLATEEGQQVFKENEYLTKICTNCVAGVVDILEQIR